MNAQELQTFGKVPPHDLDAEAAVLAASLLSSEALDDVADLLQPAHFYSEANGYIWGRIQAIRAESKPVDVVIVGQAIRAADMSEQIGGSAYLAQLVDATPAVANVRQHAEIVVGMWRLRQAIRLCHERAAIGYSAASAVEDFMSDLERDVMALRQTGEPSHFVTMSESVRAVAETSLRDSEAKCVGLTTGFRDLDESLCGMSPGDLLIVAGRPGMGKSAFAGAMVRRAADLCTAGVFSLEMPHEQVTKRMIAAEGGIDLRRLRSNQLSADEWAANYAASEVLTKLPIVYDDSAGLRSSDIHARARRMASAARRNGAPPLGLVVVDYLQRMRPERTTGSRNDQVGESVRLMKTMARELRIPVVLLSQLNRAVETRGGTEKRPQLADLRESGEIEQEADVVLFLYRQSYYEKAGSADNGDAECIIAKQRNGPTGVVNLRWFGGSCSFSDASGAPPTRTTANAPPATKDWSDPDAF